MQNYDLRYDEHRYAVADAAPSTRAKFVQRVYGHMAGAILAFVAIEGVLLMTPLGGVIWNTISAVRFGPLALMLAFMAAGHVASMMAHSARTNAMRYAGLGLYVVAEAIIFLPLLYFAEVQFPGQRVALQAGIVTLAAFAGLTFATAVSGKNFSFLGPIIWTVSWAILALIVVSVIFGFNLGAGFSFAMVIFASVAIVYQTSNVMHEYTEDQYVGAALELFASIALMFWYVLRLFMQFGNNND